MTRTLANVLVGASLVVGVSACGKSSTKTSSTTKVACDANTAQNLKEVSIQGSKFGIECARTTAGTQFFFTNKDDVSHALSAMDSPPEPLEAELPHKDSTLAHAFTAKGRYLVQCKDCSPVASMTLYVQ